MGLKDIKKGLKAAAAATRMARNPVELLKMALPEQMRGKHLLNDGEPAEDAPTGGELAVALRGLRNRLKGDAYVVESGGVDYTKLEASQVFVELQRTSRALKLLDLATLSTREQQLAFWINLYNVQVIHGVIALGISESVKEIPSFFTTIAYQIGQEVFTPDDIEHGILRCNAAHSLRKKAHFKESDTRKRWVMERLDPRIHLALVCVAQGCPPIAFYDAERVDEQLDWAAEGFVNGGVIIDHEARVLETSSIFSWYGEDFGGQAGMYDFFIQHADPPLREDLERARDQSYAWEFQAYDWSLNAL